MLGAIIGDIAWSQFKTQKTQNKEFEIFTENCHVTDEGIMTFAVAKAAIESSLTLQPSICKCGFDNDYYFMLSELTMRYALEFAQIYPNSTFNKSTAIRASLLGFSSRTQWEAGKMATSIAAAIHNNEDTIKETEVTAYAIYMAKHGALKSEIRNSVIFEYYPLDSSKIRSSYTLSVLCKGTAAQAIDAFLESSSFEHAIRIALSLEGDSSAIASITGAIAEAFYGIPESIKDKALSFLDKELLELYNKWARFSPSDKAKFRFLTKYIGKISALTCHAELWELQSIDYSKLIAEFRNDLYQFSDNCPEFQLHSYMNILERNALGDYEKIFEADVSVLDAQCVLALVMGAVRADRFCEGALYGVFEDGSMIRWLKRLSDIDEAGRVRKVTEFHFGAGGYDSYENFHITFNKDKSANSKTTKFREPKNKNAQPEEKEYYQEYDQDETVRILKSFDDIHTEYWNYDYNEPDVYDGTRWKLIVCYDDGSNSCFSGLNSYPENWDDFVDILGIYNNDD